MSGFPLTHPLPGRAARLAPLSGVAGIGCLVAGLAADRAPTSSWSDARIAAWYATHGNAAWLVSAYLIAAAAPFLLLFTAVVRERLAGAGASRAAQTVVIGAGVALAVTELVGAALYAAVPAARVFSRAPSPSADVSRYLLGASYGTLVMFSAFAAALFTAATCLASIRTRAVPRWLAVAGLPFAVLMLLNAVLPMAAITLWFVAAGVTLAVVRPPVAQAAAQAGAPAAVRVG
jgi:hypothetical protein